MNVEGVVGSLQLLVQEERGRMLCARAWRLCGYDLLLRSCGYACFCQRSSAMLAQRVFSADDS